MRNLDERLSPHFSLKELTRTSLAQIDNWPTDDSVVKSLTLLCRQVLEPIRIHVKKPIIIHSGYRCPALNKAIGGSLTSQHMKGQAADFHVHNMPNYELAKWIDENVDFDQLILENFIPGKPDTGWIHCSFSSKQMRNQALTKFKGSVHYLPGLRVK
jgi:hypothetical protein